MNIIVLVRTCSLKDKYFDNSAVKDINVDIMTGEKLSSILVANMDIIHWSVRSSSRREGNGVIGLIVI